MTSRGLARRLLPIKPIFDLLARVYDYFDTHRSKKRLEKVTVWLAVCGFFAHLLLIALARNVSVLRNGWLSELDLNFLHAVYTPFSFILFYEVLLLVFAIPRSQTSSIGKQYEILSLIIIRRVFKDIGEFRDPTAWLSQFEDAVAVVMDMGAAVLMFLLVAGFYRVRKCVVRSDSNEDLPRFLTIKKSLAVVLCFVLLGLAGTNFFKWILGVLMIHSSDPVNMDLDLFFFPEFFSFMIFADVLLLILSLPFYERYEYVIRNSGFVISTVLLRFALATPKPYDLLVALLAMFYGLCVLAVFAYYTRMSTSETDTTRVEPPPS